MPIQNQDRPPAHDERPAKRSRVSRACDQCRVAREKCDGTQPGCLTCAASNRSCTYTSAPKKRGIQPGYIRTLELTLSWLFQNTDSEAVLSRKLVQEGISSALFGRDTRESNKLHKSWRRSKFCKQVDKLLSGEQRMPNEDGSVRSDDEDSDPDADRASLPNRQLIPPNDDFSPSAHFIAPRVADANLNHNPAPHDSFAVLNSRQSQSDVATKLPSSTWRLLEVYFAYTQSWLPICEKHDMLRVSYSYPEAGLDLTSTDPSNSGDHAELWSVLAVAAHQARMGIQQESSEVLDPVQLYRVARDLIPIDSGVFQVGHVRALLNLAVVNLACERIEVAWLLAGSASRILSVVERSSQTNPPRWEHLVSGCFVLDSFLSLQLRQRPHLQKSDVDHAGYIREDGLEEWQPWINPLQSTSAALPRTPALSLSSFNKLLEIVNILNLSNNDTSTSSFSSEMIHIGRELKMAPLNPAATLLQLTYFVCASTSSLADIYLPRIWHLLEQCRTQLGIIAVPPPTICLLAYLQTSQAFRTLDSRSKTRLQRFGNDLVQAWSISPPENLSALTSTQSGPSGSTLQIPTPESIQISFNTSHAPSDRQTPARHRRPNTNLLDDLLPDMNPTAPLTRGAAHPQNSLLPNFDSDVQRTSLHGHSSAVSRDLETFFDELASLDGAEGVNNQPQFMQNLGFAPDANMADFLAAEFGQFTATNSTNFMPQNNDLTQLDPSFFGPT